MVWCCRRGLVDAVPLRRAKNHATSLVGNRRKAGEAEHQIGSCCKVTFTRAATRNRRPICDFAGHSTVRRMSSPREARLSCTGEHTSYASNGSPREEERGGGFAHREEAPLCRWHGLDATGLETPRSNRKPWLITLLSAIYDMFWKHREHSH